MNLLQEAPSKAKHAHNAGTHKSTPAILLFLPLSSTIQSPTRKSPVRTPQTLTPDSQLHDTLPPGIVLVSAPDLNAWTIDLSVLDPSHPIYAHATYRLRFRFSDKYPIEAPETFFVAVPKGSDAGDPGCERRIPLHPHIYSNGLCTHL